MNSLKNLLIVAILAGVGYGVYTSLQRNNVDPPAPPGVVDGVPGGLKVELPKSPSSGGPLALGGNASRPANAPNVSLGTPVPPLAASPNANPSASPLGGATTVAPYTSSTPSGANTSSQPAPSAALGEPMSASAVAAMTGANGASNGRGSLAPAQTTMTPDGVRNLNPPSVPAAPDAVAAPASPSAPAVDKDMQAQFTAFMDAIEQKLRENKLAEAHAALSQIYTNPDLPAEQAKQITALLDQLAGTVIYSRQHLLEPAYMTQQGDTLDRVAQKYSVPWQLLAKINGLMPPNASNNDETTKDQPLPVGMELKVVRGPFDAIIHTDKHELTLLVQNRYAGRFSIGIGRDQPQLNGNYTVCNKTLNPPYYGSDGVNANPNDPNNPLGGAWIGLSDRIGIHGTNDPQAVGRDDNRGTICVGNRDLQDLYGILSVGSRVAILR